MIRIPRRTLLLAGLALALATGLLVIFVFWHPPRPLAPSATTQPPINVPSIPTPTGGVPLRPPEMRDSPAPALPGVSTVPSATIGPTQTHQITPATPLGESSPTPTLTPPPIDDSTPTLQPPAILLSFSGDGPGQTSPVELPPGVYRVILKTQAGFDALTPIVVSGECSAYTLFQDEPGPFEGSATYRSIGCRVAFELTGIGGPWTLTVETATQGDLLAPPLTLSGSKPATSDLIDLPAGEYRVVLDTRSQYTMLVVIVVGGDCLERPIILATEPGRYQTGYSSAGCLIVLQIGSVTDFWEISLTPDD